MYSRVSPCFPSNMFLGLEYNLVNILDGNAPKSILQTLVIYSQYFSSQNAVPGIRTWVFAWVRSWVRGAKHVWTMVKTFYSLQNQDSTQQIGSCPFHLLRIKYQRYLGCLGSFLVRTQKLEIIPWQLPGSFANDQHFSCVCQQTLKSLHVSILFTKSTWKNWEVQEQSHSSRITKLPKRNVRPHVRRFPHAYRTVVKDCAAIARIMIFAINAFHLPPLTIMKQKLGILESLEMTSAASSASPQLSARVYSNPWGTKQTFSKFACSSVQNFGFMFHILILAGSCQSIQWKKKSLSYIGRGRRSFARQHTSNSSELKFWASIFQVEWGVFCFVVLPKPSFNHPPWVYHFW